MSDLTIREYAEQRRWDSWTDDEDFQHDSARALRDEGAYAAYLDIIHFLDGAYRPEYLEAVAERIQRRLLVGPKNAAETTSRI